jgi:hypothetical protein
MTTPRTRSLVSLAAALAFTFAVGGCASAPSRLATDAPIPAEGPAPTVRFDNDSRDYVDVYLVSERRDWRLARVAAGAHAMLRIPEEALADDAGRMRLAVLPAQRVTLRPSSDLRASSALARPIADILLQQWTFSQTLAQGQPAGLLLGRFPMGRP